MNTPAWRLLAVDVDGTLIHHGRLDPGDVEALRRAAAAGIVVCLCTGRTWNEVRDVWRELELPGRAGARPGGHAPVVCVGGALVVEPDTGRTLYARPFDRPTAADLAEAMRRTGQPVMALVDGWREDFDYYMIGPHEHEGSPSRDVLRLGVSDPMYRRFFARRDHRLRPMERLDPGAPGPRPLRISILTGDRPAGDALVERLRAQFAGRIEAQRIYLAATDAHIVEAFAAGTDKCTALRYVGQGLRIAPAAMAAIGDDYNDLAMLRGVGLAGVPSDAPEALREVADVIVAPCGQGPVAEFVGRVCAANGRTA